jgi:tetratricopeptide (TPR) repeat protein
MVRRTNKGIVRPRELISIPLSLNGRDHARSIDPFDLPSSGSDGRSSRSVYKAQHYSRNYAHNELAQAYLERHMFAEAIAQLQTAIQISGESAIFSANLARAYAATNRKAEAVQLLNDLKRRSASTYAHATATANDLYSSGR